MPAPEGSSRGNLKIYLGYAAGVGKTFQMLLDARDVAQHGTNLVVGYFEPHERPDTIAQVQGLQVIPNRKIQYRERMFEEMDTDAVIRRKPKIALVDELAHTNIPGSERAKRWEDVQLLLEVGVSSPTSFRITRRTGEERNP